MEEIDKQLNNLSLVEVPPGVHQSVLKRVSYEKIKPVLFIVFIVFILNFLITIWHINMSLINAEFTDMAHDFFEVFSFNFSFINTILGSFFEIISPMLVLSAALSLVGAVYVWKKISFYQLIKI